MYAAMGAQREAAVCDAARRRQQDLGPHHTDGREEISLKGTLAKRVPFAYLDEGGGLTSDAPRSDKSG